MVTPEELAQHALLFPGENVCVYIRSKNGPWEDALVYTLFKWILPQLSHEVVPWTWIIAADFEKLSKESWRMLEFAEFKKLTTKQEVPA